MASLSFAAPRGRTELRGTANWRGGVNGGTATEPGGARRRAPDSRPACGSTGIQRGGERAIRGRLVRNGIPDRSPRLPRLRVHARGAVVTDGAPARARARGDGGRGGRRPLVDGDADR